MIVVLICLIALAYGSYTDIKTREIPDTLSIGMIFLGFAIAIGITIASWSYKPLLASLVGFVVCVLIGIAFYYTGQWGGGDAKVLMGLGSLIGINVFMLNQGIPELGLFFINLILFGAFYGIVWLLSLAIINWHLFRPAFREARRNAKMIRLRIIFLGLVVLFTLFVLILKPDFMISIIVYLILLFAVISLYLFLLIKTVEKTCLLKKIKISKLTEGDWVVEKVNMKNANKFIYTKIGITAKGIKMLKSSGKKNILVKEGIPFVPNFLIAYIATLAIGNWIPVF
ncbi:MAG: A24 family peptidase [Candidatus Woesearchaeota archaeon]|jgi:Flp pilus assembly protein protease CpaA